MKSSRTVSNVWASRETLEGAGVRLYRVFGNNETELTDPFLLLDDFHSEDPQDYMAGFPWHPHRGIETVTYMISGAVEHGDSMGNKGVISSGDVQWMSAGSGIIHQEMPRKHKGMMQGFQLWVNLPKNGKMSIPKYRGINSYQIPTVKAAGGASVKVIAGDFQGTKGPVKDLMVDVTYLDVHLGPTQTIEIKVRKGHTILAYVYQGEAIFDEVGNSVKERHLALLSDGAEVKVKTQKEGVDFLLVSGKPLKEPIAWAGPIVMNTQEELEVAFEELDEGTFIKGRTRGTQTET